MKLFRFKEIFRFIAITTVGDIKPFASNIAFLWQFNYILSFCMWCLFKKSDNIQAIISNDDSSKHKSNQTLWNPYSEAAFTFKMIRKELALRIMCSQMAKLLPYTKYHFSNSLSGPFVTGSSYLLLFGTTLQTAYHSCKALQDCKNYIWKLLRMQCK